MACLCSGDDRHVLPRNRPLFLDTHQFCEAFFHAKACHEWKTSELCLDGTRQCYRTVVFAIAVLTEPHEEEPYVCRFMNCYRGASEYNVHAEQFLFADPKIQNATKGNLIIYLTYQPCHLSGGDEHVSSHGISCSALILTYLSSRPELHLEIVCSNIYRAHHTDPTGFESQEHASAFASRVTLAQEGIRMLCEHPQIDMRAFHRSDWNFLLSLVPTNVPISEQQWQQRNDIDQHIQSHLNSYRHESAANLIESALGENHKRQKLL